MRRVHAHPAGRTNGPITMTHGRTFCGLVASGRNRRTHPFTVTSDPKRITCKRCLKKLPTRRG